MLPAPGHRTTLEGMAGPRVGGAGRQGGAGTEACPRAGAGLEARTCLEAWPGVGLTCTRRDAGAPHRLEAETRPEARHAATTGVEAWSRGEKPAGSGGHWLQTGSRGEGGGTRRDPVSRLGQARHRQPSPDQARAQPAAGTLALHARNQYPEEVPFSGEG